MGRLDGKVSLILGGAGYVGEGIVRSFLDEGAFVIVPSRSPERLQGLRKVLGSTANERLVPGPAYTRTAGGAEAVRPRTPQRLHGLRGLAASRARFRSGPRLSGRQLEGRSHE